MNLYTKKAEELLMNWLKGNLDHGNQKWGNTQLILTDIWKLKLLSKNEHWLW